MTAMPDTMPRAASVNWIKFSVLAVVLAALAFILSPNGPLGGFWPPHPHLPAPNTAQLPLLILLNLIEVAAFEIGIAFLFFAWPAMRAIAPASLGLTRAAHLSIAWLLFSWWPHDSLHVSNGMELEGLIVIEYVFHVTLMIGGIILAWFFVTLHSRPS